MKLSRRDFIKGTAAGLVVASMPLLPARAGIAPIHWRISRCNCFPPKTTYHLSGSVAYVSAAGNRAWSWRQIELESTEMMPGCFHWDTAAAKEKIRAGLTKECPPERWEREEQELTFIDEVMHWWWE
jgi:hypothetical protein